MVLSLSILFSAFAATYYVMIPRAARSVALTSKGIFSGKENKDEAIPAQVLVLMTFVVAGIIYGARHDPEILRAGLQLGLFVMAVCGIYLVVNSWIQAVAFGVLMLGLLVTGIGGEAFLDFTGVFVVLGTVLLTCRHYSLKGVKSLLILTAGDVLLISIGTTTHVFPLAFELAHGHFFGFFYLPASLKIGCGDLLGLSLLAVVTLREKSNRTLVFLVYSAAFAICAAVTISGMVVAFPATVPLLPALLCHQLTRRRAATPLILTPEMLAEAFKSVTA
jgi:hypothetical protein